MASTVVTAVGPDLPSRIHDTLQNYVNGCEIREHFERIAESDEAAELEASVSTVLALIKLSASDERKKCLETVQSFAHNTEAYSRQRLIFKHVLIRAADEQIISLKSLFENLLKSVDFTLNQPIDHESIAFIHRRLTDLDYKTVRDIFKILIDKMASAVPVNISDLQKRRFDPIERLIVDIADREHNYLPAYFVMNELNRLTLASQIHICFGVWRIAEKFAQVTQSFRPLAEITCIIGRPFLLPVFGHLSLNPLNLNIEAKIAVQQQQQHVKIHYGNASLWKLDPAKLTFSTKSPLPYAYEYNCAQTYLLYQMFKQPFSRDHVINVCSLRDRSSRADQSSPQGPLTDIIGMLIHDAIITCEEQKIKLRLHWTHLAQLAAFLAQNKSIIVSRLLSQLKRNLAYTPCTIARDDVMWLLLEVLVVVDNESRPKSAEGTTSAEKLSADDIQTIVDIYFAMYSGSEELTFAGGNLEMARAMAPTCLWMHLARIQQATGKPALKLPPSIESQKSFIDEMIGSPEGVKELQSNEFMLAVFINTFIMDEANLKKLNEVVKAKFDQNAAAHDRYAYSMSFCDALIWRAKNNVANTLLLQLSLSQQYRPNVPYPAQIESVARLVSSIDTEYSLLRTAILYNVFPKTVELAVNEQKEHENQVQLQCQQNPQAAMQMDTVLTASHTLPTQQKLFIYTEMFTCRIPPSQWTFDRRCTLFLHLCRAMRALQTNAALFLGMEHCLLRHWCSLSPGDCMLVLTNSSVDWFDFSMKQGANQYKGAKPPNVIPQSIFGLDPFNGNLAPFHNDVHRVIVHVIARSMHMLGAELPREDMLSLLGAKLCWPECTLAQMPSALSASINERMQHNQQELVIDRENMKQHLMKEYHKFTAPSDDTSLLKYFSNPNLPPVLFCIIWQCMFEQHQMSWISLRIVDKMPVPRMLANLEKLVDYILPRLVDQQYVMQVANVVEQMIWKHCLFPLERFLLAMVMQPSNDHELHMALQFISFQLQNSSEFRTRLQKILKEYTCHISDLGQMPLNYLRNYHQEHPNTNVGMKFAQCYGERYAPTSMHVNFLHMGERLLPVMDIIISKCIESSAPLDSVTMPLLELATPVFKFHAQPITFVYQTLFYYNPMLQAQPQLRMELLKRVFVAANVASLLSPELQNQTSGHLELASGDYYRAIVERLMMSVEQHILPSMLYEKDWRYNEFANVASRTLHVTLCELLSVDVEPSVVGASLISVVTDSVWSVGCASMLPTINAVALLITALPLPFAAPLWDELEQTIGSDSVRTADPVAFVRSLEDTVNVGADTKAHRVLMLTHAVFMHATPALINRLSSFSRTRVVPLISTESQLMYVIRLTTPFMSRMHQEKSVSERVILDLTTDLYEMLGRVDRTLGDDPLQYEDTLCDLLYHLKYNFVGYGVENDTMPIVKQLRKSLIRKLRYLPQTQTELTDLTSSPPPTS